VPGYYNLVAEYYSDYKGPYLLGDRVTYTDFAIYLLITIGERGRFRYDNIRSLPGRLLISLCLVGLAGCFGQFQGGL
jgi:glutathione S-transferase